MTEIRKEPFALRAGRVFSPTAPIDERSLFAGRADQLRALLKAISQKGQHAIVYGERGVGKTSLVNVLTKFMDQGVIAPRVNCDSTDNFDLVWRKLFEEISFATGGRTVPDVPTVISPEAVRRILTALSSHSLVIPIIDEFDRLNAGVKRQIADTVKTLSDHAVAATVVLVGVADSVNELIEEHESVERALIQIPMPRMSTTEIEEIVQTGVSKLDMQIEPYALERIASLARGLPTYAHLLGLKAVEIANDEDSTKITGATADKAITQALEGAQQSIRHSWHTATSSPRKDNLFSEVLVACALAQTDEMGFFAAQDVRDPLREILKRPIEIANYSQHLAEFCDPKKGPVLQRRGTARKYRFRFCNPLFQPYVVMKGYALHMITD